MRHEQGERVVPTKVQVRTNNEIMKLWPEATRFCTRIISHFFIVSGSSTDFRGFRRFLLFLPMESRSASTETIQQMAEVDGFLHQSRHFLPIFRWFRGRLVCAHRATGWPSHTSEARPPILHYVHRVFVICPRERARRSPSKCGTSKASASSPPKSRSVPTANPGRLLSDSGGRGFEVIGTRNNACGNRPTCSGVVSSFLLTARPDAMPDPGHDAGHAAGHDASHDAGHDVINMTNRFHPS